MREQAAMFASYLKTGLRALLRQKVHLALNLIGLSVGLAAAVLILLYVQFERGYDQMHPQAEQTYRVEQLFVPLDQRFPISSPAILGEFQTFDARIEGTRMFAGSDNVRPPNAQLPLQLETMSIEANFTDYFTFDTIAGDFARVVSDPGFIALTREQSQRLFGRSDSVGETLTGENQVFTVAAVIELPEQSHFHADSLRLAAEADLSQPLMMNNAFVYVHIPDDVDHEQLLASVSQALNDKAYSGQTMATIHLRALTDIHLRSQLSYEHKTNGSRATLLTASVLAGLLLLVASINFINMSIARSGSRAKEVGVRKTLGASRWQLFTQFMLESLMVAFIAGFLAAVMVELGVGAFSSLVNRPISLEYFGSFGALLLLCSAVIGVLAGIYPALFISAFNAKRVLSGDLQRGSTAVWVRKGLLVAQGAITVALLIGSAILQQQLNILLNQDTGYQTEARLIVHGIDNEQLMWSDNQSLLTDITTMPGVRAASAMDIDLTNTYSQIATLRIPGQTEADRLPPVASFGAAYHFVEATGLNLRAGRDFDPNRQADWFALGEEQASASAIVTASLARQAGYSNVEEVIGQRWMVDDAMPTELHIVGVVDDFQVGPALRRMEPAVIIAGRSPMNYANMIIHLEPATALRTRAEIEGMLQQRLNRMDIRTSWLGADFTAMYQNQQRQRTIIMLFAGLAILLTCIGLFGLAAFSAEQRSKEVAMRKVLGASRMRIVNTLAKEYMVLMAISVLVAVPGTYFLVEWWLSGFNVRASQNAALYLAAATLTFAICWLTVAGISMRVASRKPGLVLRQF
ncbi:ABC transporter permease [Aliidiomarina minuta]|uniref:ABC transporter permease n=1 Tax=Aliidiomarina minuta TaxID=880057 RepID=A0A432W9C9_9GAMM|nr:ABC transporter permease [Aliidiomarina minuta]RUO26586.1 ABC transporter permease [Aliidiomarina minuta]